MSFNAFASSLSKKLQEISTSVSEKTQELPSLAQSTQRMVQERLGQVTDISQLPREYTELEDKVDTIKLIYNHFLGVTAIYENGSYDYPKYINESVNEFSRSVASKLTELTHATSASEAQNILVAPGPIKEPKTLNYALSKVALNSSECLNKMFPTEEQPLASALLQFSDVQAKIAQARIQQDTLIQTKFNKNLRERLSFEIGKADKCRKDVHSMRLRYDVARTNLANNKKPEKEASLRVQMETLEDQFAQVTEDATVCLQEVISHANFSEDLKELAKAQAEYFETSAGLMKEFLSNSFAEEPAAKPEVTEEEKPQTAISMNDEDDA